MFRLQGLLVVAGVKTVVLLQRAFGYCSRDPGDNGLDQVAIDSGEAPLFLEFLLGAQFRVDECLSDGRGVHTEHRARLINCGSPPGRDSNA